MPIQACWAASATESAIQSVVTGLVQSPPARVDFTEIRFLHVMDRPLQVAGEMAWLGGDHLRRTVARPVFEQVDIEGERVVLQRHGHAPRHFSLRRAAGLQLMLQSFTALLGGDLSQLQSAFGLSLQSRGQQGWTLDLTPRDASLRRQMPHLAIDGQGRQLRCMRIEEAQGDRSVELFGPLAVGISATARFEDLQQRCQAAG